MAARSRLLLLIGAALASLGSAGDFPIPSECAVGMYLPPINGSPQSDGQRVAIVPASTETFRLQYGTSRGAMTSYEPSSAGTSVTADTRHEFVLSALSSDTTYYWRVNCYEDGRWKLRGWEGSFTTLPASGGELRILVGTDWHWLSAWMANPTVPPPSNVQRNFNGVDLLSRHRDVHAYIDNGDTFHFHCRAACDDGWELTDDFGRLFGANSITFSATTQAEEIAFGEARASWVLRKMWRFLRFVSLLISRGNHDVGGAFGDNGPGRATVGIRHVQSYPGEAWVQTGISITLPDDLAADGVFSEPSHGMSDGDGPYRWVPTSPRAISTTIYPWMNTCSGSRPAGSWSNEWWIDTDGLPSPSDSFRVAYNDTDAGCTSVTAYGNGTATLLRGGDMRYSTKQVTAKYFPNQNDVYPHGWGPPEDGIMGPILLSDYALVLNLDEYDHSPTPAYQPTPPWSNRDVDAWSLGAQQQAGALDVIDDLGVPGSGYDDVEVLLVVMHHTPGGHTPGPGYAYGRGGLCEPDSRCYDSPSTECEQDADCGGSDLCEPMDCSADFAHGDWQAVHEAMAAFVTRTGGIAIVILGHDHQNSGGVKDGVYYYTAGQVGGDSIMAGWGDAEYHKRRHDYDGDGVPAYLTDYARLGISPEQYSPAAGNDFPEEWGTEFRGYSLLTICPSSGVDACPSGKPEIELIYYINEEELAPQLHGTPAYTFTLQGP